MPNTLLDLFLGYGAIFLILFLFLVTVVRKQKRLEQVLTFLENEILLQEKEQVTKRAHGA